MRPHWTVGTCGESPTSARLIGRQFYRQLREILQPAEESASGFGRFLLAMAQGEGGGATATEEPDGIVVAWAGRRLLGAVAAARDRAFEAWAGLWEGCLATHDRFLALKATPTADGARLRIVARRPATRGGGARPPGPAA